LFSSHHKNSPKSKVTGIIATLNRLSDRMLQCSMNRIIGIKMAQSGLFVAAQQKTNNRRYWPARAVRDASVPTRARRWHNPALDRL
jgi:hypothetical protein